MKKIYARAIEMADPMTIKKKLIIVIDQIKNSDHIERFLDILFDADVKEEELPRVVERYDEVRTRKGFNYLSDIVYYDYVRTTKKYFANEEDAAKYAKSGDYDYNTSKSTRHDEYPYEGVYVTSYESYCTLYEWMNSKVLEK